MLETRAKSSAKSKSSSLVVIFHLISVLAPSTDLLITQSITKRNRHPDMLHLSLTPDFTSNQICSSITIHNGTCAISVHDLYHSHDLCRYSIAPHDLPGSVSVCDVEGLLVVHETMVGSHSASCSTIFLNTKICSVVFLPFLKPTCSPINSTSVPATILLIRTLPNTLATMNMRVIPLQFSQLVKSPFLGSLMISPLSQSSGTLSASHILLNNSCRTWCHCQPSEGLL